MKKIIFVVSCLLFSAFFIMPASAENRVLPVDNDQIKLSFSPLVKKTAPAVVNIYTSRTVATRLRHPFLDDPFFSPFFRNDLLGRGGLSRKRVENTLGSGVIVDPSGLVITNTHVIKGAEEITVMLSDGREYEAEIKLKDEPSDLALLRIDTKGESLPHIPLKSSESLEVGDLILAIGNPFGVGQTVTSGIVSALARSALNVNDYNFFIQTDAAINPGNSGGPLVSMDGYVVGINTAIYSRDGGSLGIGFAIPSEMVATLIAAEKTGHVAGNGAIIRPWLGITAQKVTADIADSLEMSMPHGALITSLHQASPAKKGGMQVGDVVVSVNGKDVRDPAEMRFRMAMIPINENARFTFLRKGKQIHIDVKAIAPPEIPERDTLLIKGRNPLSGASISRINPALMVELGLVGPEEGIVISAVEKNSRAARMIEPGVTIVAINDVEIKTPLDVQQALDRAAGRGYKMKFLNNGRVQTVIIR